MGIDLEYVKGNISADEYWSAQLDSLHLDAISENCSELVDEVKASLSKAFFTLTELDIEDEFWAGTNRKATLHKLNDFARLNIERSIDIEFWVWIKACLDFVSGTYHLNKTTWDIVSDDHDKRRWLLLATLNTHLLTGQPLTDNISGLLESLESRSVYIEEIRKIQLLSSEYAEITHGIVL